MIGQFAEVLSYIYIYIYIYIFLYIYFHSNGLEPQITSTFEVTGLSPTETSAFGGRSFTITGAGFSNGWQCLSPKENFSLRVSHRFYHKAMFEQCLSNIRVYTCYSMPLILHYAYIGNISYILYFIRWLFQRIMLFTYRRRHNGWYNRVYKDGSYKRTNHLPARASQQHAPDYQPGRRFGSVTCYLIYTKSFLIMILSLLILHSVCFL